MLARMVLRVTQYGEPVLRQPGQRIVQFDEALRKLSEEMIETMYAEDGAGLAAQQVGEALQLCVIDIGDLEPELLDFQLDGKRPPIDLIMPLVLVNPELKVLPGRKLEAEEGCLSFPGIRIRVARPEMVEVHYQDVEGGPHVLRAGGWFARVIQHEYDHLQGVLFIDHLATKELRQLDSKLKKLKRAARKQES